MERYTVSRELAEKLKAAKPIAGFENYLVTSDGQVYSTKRKLWLKQSVRGQYYCVSLSRENHWRSHFVHRLVAGAFMPNPNALRVVNHLDGDKFNNHVDNLEWSTDSANQEHAYRTGLQNSDRQIGENNWKAKLAIEDVLNIEVLKLTRRSGEVAKMYGISRQAVEDIWAGRRWAKAIANAKQKILVATRVSKENGHLTKEGE